MDKRDISKEVLLSLPLRCEAIIAALPAIIMEMGMDKIYQWANQAGLEFFGDEVLGKEFSHYFVGEQDSYDRLQPLFDGYQQAIYIESWQRRQDGEPRLLGWHFRTVKDENGNVSGAIAIAQDITEQRQVAEQSRLQNQLFEKAIESLPHPFYVIDANNYTIKIANKATRLFGALTEDTTCYALTHNRKQPCCGMRHGCPLDEVRKTKKPVVLEHIHYDKHGNTRYVEIHGYPILDEAGNVIQMIEYSLDITDRKQAEADLRNALETAKQRQAEVSALLDGARVVLQYQKFEDAAQAIFFSCRKLLGATAGYLALLNREHGDGERLFFDPGGLNGNIDESLFSRLDGLREKAQRTGETVYDNNFGASYREEAFADGQVPIYNALFAPLKLDEDVVGFLVVANKPGGFNENDAKMATAFGELASVALINSRSLESLETSEQRFRSITETASDAIITINIHGEIVNWNRAAQKIFGYSIEEVLGKNITRLMPERFREAHQKGMKRVSSVGQLSYPGRTYETIGLRKDGTEFPVELSISCWKAKHDWFFTGILRDITARKIIEQELKKSHDELESRVIERTKELMDSNRALRKEIAERKRTEQQLLEYQQRLRSLASELTLTEERQRRHFATDLHDSIGQTLAISKMKLSQLRNLSANVEMGKQIDEIYALIEQTIRDTRTLTFELSPPILYELGLEAAVEWLTERFQQQHGIATHFIDDGNSKPLDDDIRVILFRKVRELLFNIAKHASAQNVTVSMIRENNNIRIEIADDGVGFDVATLGNNMGKNKGFGLFSIRERLDFLGGKLEIDSRLGEGTRVVLVAPLST